MSTLIQAQIIAAHLWFAGGPKRTPKKISEISDALEITKDEIRAILRSAEYLVAVKHLMMITRTPKQLKKWIESLGSKMPDHLAERMELSWDDASDLTHEVYAITLQELSKEEDRKC